MNSAAKLRKRGIAAIGATALIATSFGPAALASWDDAPQTTGTTESSTKQGTIGIVDTDKTGPASNPIMEANTTAASLNHGARLVQAGQKDQPIADIQFVLPNSFKSGDIIDLRLLDRSATEHSDGTSNAGVDTLLGFSADPTLSVGEPAAADTRLTPDTEDIELANVATAPVNAWSAAPGATGEEAKKPGVAPVFQVSRTQSNGVQGYDNIRLRITGNPSTGDPSGRWVVTLSGLKVDLGPQVTPGELRVVPFASNKFDNGEAYYASPWFQENIKPGAVDAANQPYFSTADKAREIGTYTVPAYVSPVVVSSEKTSIVADGRAQSIGTLSLSETKPYALATGQYTLRIVGAQIANVGSTDIQAKLTGGDAGESVSSVVASNSGSDGLVTFNFTANTSNPTTIAKVDITGLLLQTNTPSELQFNFSGGSLTDSWLAQAGQSQAVAGTAIAASAAFVNQGAGADGDIVVASTKQIQQAAPRAASVVGAAGKLSAGEYTVTPNATTSDTADFTVTGATETVGSRGAGTPIQSGSLLKNGEAFIAEDTAPDTNHVGLTDGDTLTFNNLTAGTTITIDGTGKIVATRWTDPITLNNFTNLPAGTYTVSVNSSTTDATDFTIAGPNGLQLGSSTTAGATSSDIIVNGAAYTTAAGNYAPGTTKVALGASYTFDNLFAPTTFTISGYDAYTLAEGVNQQDIAAPTRDLLQTGVATAPISRIGGNNRYETAAKVAQEFAWDLAPGSGTVRNVIIASGENYPDALSSSYLSQVMGAPVLLTGKNWLPDDTIKALRDMEVQNVFVIGGDQAISSDIESRLRDLPTYTTGSDRDFPVATGAKMSVLRIAGATRYSTNQLVNYYAAARTTNGTIGKTNYRYGEPGKYTAVFARGDNFADALAAGVLTAGESGGGGNAALPLVLTAPGQLAESAAQQMDRLDVQHVIMVGGPAALSDDVKKSIEDKGASTTRLSGPEGSDDRYFTAAAVNEFAMRDDAPSSTNEYPGLGFLNYLGGKADPANQSTAFLANGLNYPDALTAAPWIGQNRDALSLVQPKDLTNGTKDFLSKRAADIQNAIALGLGDAVSTAVLNEANALVSVK